MKPDFRYGAVRSVLITIGVAAYAWLFRIPDAAAGAAADGTGRGYVLAGIVVQLALMAMHAVVKRRVEDPELVERTRNVLELVGDGVTVLLFAVGVLGQGWRAAGAA